MINISLFKKITFTSSRVCSIKCLRIVSSLLSILNFDGFFSTIRVESVKVFYEYINIFQTKKNEILNWKLLFN